MTFSNNAIPDFENHQKAMLIQVTNAGCFQCMKEDLTLFSSLNPDLITTYHMDSGSDWAQKKRQEYQITRQTFTILITKDNQEIILPQNISMKELYAILKQSV